jgi:hypothetical protein
MSRPIVPHSNRAVTPGAGRCWSAGWMCGSCSWRRCSQRSLSCRRCPAAPPPFILLTFFVLHGLSMGSPGPLRMRWLYCNVIEAPWLVNSGHGASLRHHNV